MILSYSESSLLSSPIIELIWLKLFLTIPINMGIGHSNASMLFSGKIGMHA